MKRYTRYSGKIIAAVLVLATAVQQPVYAAEYSDARDVRYEQGSTELLTAGVGELFAARTDGSISPPGRWKAM